MVRSFARPSVHSFLTTTPPPKSGDVLFVPLISPYVMLSPLDRSFCHETFVGWSVSEIVSEKPIDGTVLILWINTVRPPQFIICTFQSPSPLQAYINENLVPTAFYSPVCNPSVILRIIWTQSYTNAKSTTNCRADSLAHPLNLTQTYMRTPLQWSVKTVGHVISLSVNWGSNRHPDRPDSSCTHTYTYTHASEVELRSFGSCWLPDPTWPGPAQVGQLRSAPNNLHLSGDHLLNLDKIETVRPNIPVLDSLLCTHIRPS